MCSFDLVVPTESQDGLRRSARTRVKTLDWFRGERIRYKPNKSGTGHHVLYYFPFKTYFAQPSVGQSYPNTFEAPQIT